MIRLRHAYVIPIDAVQRGQLGSSDIQPPFDAGVPGVGRLTQVVRGDGTRGGVGEIGGDKQRRYFCRDGERRIARLFLPAILRTHRTVPREKHRSLAYHRPQSISRGCVEHAVA